MDKPRIYDETIMVPTGGNAVMTVSNPDADPHLEWSLRYGSPEAVRFTAASVVESFDYLLSKNITMTEATRRLRVLRAAVRERRFWMRAPGTSFDTSVDAKVLCRTCGDTGDVHDLTGEWRGRCSCPAGCSACHGGYILGKPCGFCATADVEGSANGR